MNDKPLRQQIDEVVMLYLAHDLTYLEMMDELEAIIAANIAHKGE